ncbi:MAG: DinB family protein [Chloroflexi bacterium]|nr:DinB family protein [Chloroflexota bacterium]
MLHHDIEIELCRGRALTLEAFAALQPDELRRAVTASEHDPAVRWSPQDHLVHLAGFERLWCQMVRRKIDGHVLPMGVIVGDDGARRTREEVLANVHCINDEFVRSHHGCSFEDAVALGQSARAETLALLASLTPEQLGEKIPFAPWGDGTIGGILAANADHGNMHWNWLQEAGVSRVGD